MGLVMDGSNWEQRNARNLRKGNFGEQIVAALLRMRGYIVYAPTEGGRHPFDMIASKRKEGRFVFTIIEVKTKASQPERDGLPEATGVDTRQLQDYRKVMEHHNTDIFLAFVDERAGMVYGNYLSEIDGKGRSIKGGAHYLWDLCHFLRLQDLTPEQITKLKRI